MRRFGVGDDDIGLDRAAVGEAEARGARALAGDLRHFAVEMDVAALALHQLRHGPDQCAGSADRKMHAILPFEIGDHAVDRRHLERVAADEQRVEAERHADLGVLDAGRYMLVHGAPGAQAQQVGCDLHHVER